MYIEFEMKYMLYNAGAHKSLILDGQFSQKKKKKEQREFGNW